MANNRFNKQVTPKGYKMGGKVMGDRVGFDEGMGVKETGFKHKGRLKKLYKEIVGRDRKFRDPKDALMALTRADAGATFLKGLEKKGIDADKIRKDILKEKMKSTEFRIGTAKGKSKASDDDEKKYRVYQKGGSVKQSPMGSSSTKGNILRGKLKSQKELKKITDSKKYKDASYGEKTKMLNVATMKKGGRVRDTRKTEQMIGSSISSKREKGRVGRKFGGSLKPVQPNQKGLKKLPTEVRNKMGYMKKGGKVHGK